MNFEVGDIIRIQFHHACRVWLITGVLPGATGVESNYQMQPLDKRTGQAVGGKTTESLVPCDMLDSHSGVHRVNVRN